MGENFGDKGAYYVVMDNKFYTLFYIKTNVLSNYPKDKMFVVYIDADGIDYVNDGNLSYADFEDSFKLYTEYYSCELPTRDIYDILKKRFDYPIEFYERQKMFVESQLRIT